MRSPSLRPDVMIVSSPVVGPDWNGSPTAANYSARACFEDCCAVRGRNDL
jgi:hypothetical protein